MAYKLTATGYCGSLHHVQTFTKVEEALAKRNTIISEHNQQHPNHPLRACGVIETPRANVSMYRTWTAYHFTAIVEKVVNDE